MSITEPGALRMPNGIECALTVGEGEEATIGRGALRSARARVLAGPVWDPRPAVNVALEATPGQDLDVGSLLGSGPGLTPWGDDVLVGFVAGRVLFHGDTSTGRDIYQRSIGHTTSLSVALLFHAALGELPEAAHELLAGGDVDPLLSFGHSSGRAILLGLALAGTGRPRTSTHRPRVVPVEGIAGVRATIVRVFATPSGRADAGAGQPAHRAPGPGGSGAIAPVGAAAAMRV